jgi:hypothetical protein
MNDLAKELEYYPKPIREVFDLIEGYENQRAYVEGLKLKVSQNMGPYIPELWAS